MRCPVGLAILGDLLMYMWIHSVSKHCHDTSLCTHSCVAPCWLCLAAPPGAVRTHMCTLMHIPCQRMHGRMHC